MKEITWRCTKCDTEFTTTPERHAMQHCPNCEETWVDHERTYIRRSAGTEVVE